ncbi:MAG: pantoate--beta-alanine ligase [Candidatus Gastranaerophilales bacterium]|nr:pantoate--beta-alanine ligase [Candidatus Gastranaerophilales bacterium]
MLKTKIADIRKEVLQWKKEGLSVGLVPTMGALHQGHLSLIKQSLKKCDRTVVSVFVNPIQFGPAEDLDKYPRTLEADLELCKNAGVDIVFAPSQNEMYENTPHPNPPPQGGREQSRLSNDFFTYVIPPFFYTDKLCGKSRPGHFDGVCTVVMKLFNIVQPDYAFFGQKDAQQLVIIRKMVQDLNIPIEIVSCPIVRDENGLALSSRNQYLSEEGRKQALVLNKILTNIRACYNKGIQDVKALGETAFAFLNEHHELEYLEFVDKNTLENKTKADDDTLVLIAVKTDNVRLIDNCFMK